MQTLTSSECLSNRQSAKWCLIPGHLSALNWAQGSPWRAHLNRHYVCDISHIFRGVPLRPSLHIFSLLGYDKGFLDITLK